MSVTIVERPQQVVVGLQIRTRPMSPDIPALWPKFVARIAEIENPAEAYVSYGVMRDAGDALLYMAAVSVNALGRVPEGMKSLTLPGGTYAVFRYPLSQLGKGFGEIFGHLLPASDYVQVPGPLYERYDQSFDPKKPNSLVEIGIPVRARAG